MNKSVLFTFGLSVAFAGCGGDTKSSGPAQAMTGLGAGGPPPDSGGVKTDGKATGGESPFGPKRAEADKKISEIRANKDLSDELKKQLIDEVERTYKEAQGGFNKG